MAMGRPLSTGSMFDSEGGIRAYLHVNRLRKLSEKIGGADGALLDAAANVMMRLARKNRRLGQRAGAAMKKQILTERGVSFAREDAAEGIAELAADGAVTAYIGRDPNRVRVMRDGRLPRGAKIIGTYDAGCDYRQIVEDLAA